MFRPSLRDSLAFLVPRLVAFHALVDEKSKKSTLARTVARADRCEMRKVFRECCHGHRIGCYYAGFRLIPEVNEHCLPDLLIGLGPICVIMGGFWASFGLVHLMVTLVSADSS